MVDTIHIQPNMERNCSKGVDDFYLASCNGTITVTGSLTVEEAVELMQKKILLKKAMVKLSWLPSSAPPDMASPLAKVFSQPDVLKRLAMKECSERVIVFLLHWYNFLASVMQFLNMMNKNLSYPLKSS